MTNRAHVGIPHEKVVEFCRKWHVSEFSLFGSALRSDFRADSDFDVMVDFEPGTHHSLLDVVSMAEDLQSIFGREVDLLTRPAVDKSRNYIRRKAILESRKVIYAS